MTLCNATKSDGSPCGTVTGIGPDGRCAWHTTEPGRKQDVQRAQQKGLKAIAAAKVKTPLVPSEPMPALVTLEDCDTVAAWIVTQLAAGALDANVANAMTRALTQKRLTLYNLRDTERRLKDFKKRIADVQKGAPHE